jgi:hypothetical protein
MASGIKSLFQQANKLNPAMKLNEWTDANDPAAKALGYEGLYNPAVELQRSVAGEDTMVTKKARKNQANRAIADRTAESSGPGGHQLSIAAFKARTGRS